ncbi:hypothetical protein [Streptomyces sp. NPDC049915]|uniref:hypothetical protein n=1 Tax=Streptomyces sp. NPDC049915 TaxID=3155510 RepID=UPI003439A930
MLTSGIPGSRVLARANRSSSRRARSRPGEDVMETLLREVSGPLATPDTRRAWWRGLRLLALDFAAQFLTEDHEDVADALRQLAAVCVGHALEARPAPAGSLLVRLTVV